MANLIDDIENYLNRSQLRIDKIFYKLDSNLCKRAKEMEIPFDQQCALDDIDKIPENLCQTKERFQQMQNDRNEFILIYKDRLDQLDKRLEKILK